MVRSSRRKKLYQRSRANSGHHRRILVVTAVLAMLAFVPVSLRLFDLMVLQYDHYAGLALRNQSRTTQVTAERGIIYDVNMNILAGSQSVENVYLDPHELKQAKEDIGEISYVLGEILDINPEWIAQQATDIKMRYKLIAACVDLETASRIRQYINEQDVSGIHLEPNTKRFYPYGALASQVIGFTNASNIGSEGIEAAYNGYLAGTAGKVITTKGNNEMDMPFSYEKYVQSIPGCDVVLTLDATVQQCLEKRMAEAIARYDVQNGAFGIVMNVKTGEILAMATLGGYDPNAYLEVYDSRQAQLVEKLRVAYLLAKPVDGILVVLVREKVRYDDGKSVAPTHVGGHDGATDARLPLKLDLIEPIDAVEVGILSHHSGYHVVNAVPVHGVNGHSVHLANRKIGKRRRKLDRLLGLFIIGSVPHRTACVYVDLRMHLPLIIVKLFIKLVKARIRIPINLGHIVTRNIITIIGKFAGGSQIFASAISAKRTCNIVFEDRLQRFKLS